MFRHQGKTRNQKHNLRIAVLLSFVAGLVNVTGFLAIGQLTTNVTGHFALFINDVTSLSFWKGAVFLLYIVYFLLGSFTSSLLLEQFRNTKRLNVFVIPTLIEACILIILPVLVKIINVSPDSMACVLLFAMGLQNSYVTKISNAVVRTTHLTGLFTDLGIELAQLLFPQEKVLRQKLLSTVKLRVSIIFSFFGGGLIGGFLYSKTELQLNTLMVGAVILIGGLLFDDLRYRHLKVKRKYKALRK